MFNNISWQGYWSFLALTAALYYCFILFRYYKTEVLHLLSKSKGTLDLKSTATSKRKVWTSISPNEEYMPSSKVEAPESNPAVSSLVDELQAFFEGGVHKKHTKQSLLTSLQFICKKYPAVAGTPFQYSVNQLILFLSEQSCSVHLSAEDVVGIWL